MTPFHQHNRNAWNDRVRRGDWFIDTAGEKEFRDPLRAIDPPGWLGGVSGRHILCLAAGGGRHGPLLASLGAVVTVVDLSPRMLDLDRKIASERNLNVTVVEGSMDDLSMLPENRFDAVIQPVSTCYVPSIDPVFRQVSRVLRPGGQYLSQHKQPISLQTDPEPASGAGGYLVREAYYREGPLPAGRPGELFREHGTQEFLHRLEEILGGMCRNGFVIEDLIEPNHSRRKVKPGTFAHRCLFIPPYLAVKARRTEAPWMNTAPVSLWLPGGP